MRWALIENGTVVNVVDQATQPQVPGLWVACGGAGPGWAYDGASFTSPTPVEDSVILVRNVRSAMRAAGISDPEIDSVVAAALIL